MPQEKQKLRTKPEKPKFTSQADPWHTDSLNKFLKDKQKL